MFVCDNIIADRQSLTGSLPNILCCEKGKKDFIPKVFRDSISIVGYTNFSPITLTLCRNNDFAFDVTRAWWTLTTVPS